MKKVKKILSFVIIMTLSVTLISCGGNSTESQVGSNDSKTAENKTNSDNIIKVQSDAEVSSIDPQIATDGSSFEAISAITEGLYSKDSSGTPILAMAKDVTKSKDGLTYTFTLRDANWSNGTSVTAKDFVFGWKRLVNPKTASEYAFIAGIAGIKNADAIAAGKMPVDQLGIKAIDDKTLEVNLDNPVPYFESLMSFPSFSPVNEEFYNKCGDKFASTADNILSNGPFKVSSYQPAATTVTLEKNPEYWDASSVKLDGITYQVIKESQQAILAYQNGDVDIAKLSGEQVEQFKDDPEFVNVLSGFLWYISPNQKVKGLENLNLRKALALSYDKSAIVNNVLKDGSIEANFAIPKSFATGPDRKYYRETTDSYLKTDKAKALEYWQKAKAELGVDTVKYKLLVDDTESAQNVAQFIQAEIQTTLPEVKIELEVIPKKNRSKKMTEGDFELGLTRWGPDYTDPMTYLDMWVTNNSNNYGFWSNSEYDKIIESSKKGSLALDVNARWEALKKAEAMVMDQAVIFPIYQKGDAVLIKSNVKGVEFKVGSSTIYKNVTKN